MEALLLARLRDRGASPKAAARGSEGHLSWRMTSQQRFLPGARVGLEHASSKLLAFRCKGAGFCRTHISEVWRSRTPVGACDCDRLPGTTISLVGGILLNSEVLKYSDISEGNARVVREDPETKMESKRERGIWLLNKESRWGRSSLGVLKTGSRSVSPEQTRPMLSATAPKTGGAPARNA